MTPQTEPAIGHLVVLYDGLCGLCDGVVQFLLRHDKKDLFRFAALQSDFALGILRRHAPELTGWGPANSDTICLVEYYDSPRERVFIKSEATLRIARQLGGAWHLARVAELLPRVIADACYDVVARNRYRIFGKREECRVPSGEDRKKFLN